jgi:hypothetical protein
MDVAYDSVLRVDVADGFRDVFDLYRGECEHPNCAENISKMYYQLESLFAGNEVVRQILRQVSMVKPFHYSRSDNLRVAKDRRNLHLADHGRIEITLLVHQLYVGEVLAGESTFDSTQKLCGCVDVLGRVSP